MSQKSISSEPDATSHVSQNVGPAGESVFSKLSPDACKLLAILLMLRKNRYNKEMVLDIGKALGRHGVLGKGETVVLSAMQELEDEGVIEHLTESEEVWIRVKDEIQLVGEFKYLEENDCFYVACMMLLVGVALIRRMDVKDIELFREKCMELAKEIANNVEPDERELIWNTLSAGLCVLAKAHELRGDEKEADELREYSLKYDSTLEEMDLGITVLSIHFRMGE